MYLLARRGGGVDRVAVDNSLDVEALVQCVVEGIRNGPCSIDILLRLGFVWFVEFCFRSWVMRNVDGCVSMGEVC